MRHIFSRVVFRSQDPNSMLFIISFSWKHDLQNNSWISNVWFVACCLNHYSMLLLCFEVLLFVVMLLQSTMLHHNPRVVQWWPSAVTFFIFNARYKILHIKIDFSIPVLCDITNCPPTSVLLQWLSSERCCLTCLCWGWAAFVLYHSRSRELIIPMLMKSL